MIANVCLNSKQGCEFYSNTSISCPDTIKLLKVSNSFRVFLPLFRHTFHATNLPQLVLTIVQAKYTPVSENYSPELRDIIHSCLERDPEKRPEICEILQKPFIQNYIRKSEAEAEEDALNGV